MIRFRFKYSGIKYDICINGKYTILLGDSGTGKSLLVQLAEQFAREPEYGECSGSLGIDAMTAKRWKSALKSQAKVVIVDEDVLLDDDADDNVISLMQSTNKYFIIVSRAGVAGIPFGVNSIFVIDTVSPKHRRMIPSSHYANLLRDSVFPAHLIICEDSKSGYIAAEHIYRGSGYDVVSVGGNSNFKSMEYTSGFIVADLCGLSETTFELAELVLSNPSLQVCNVVSFEAEALRSQGVPVSMSIVDSSVDNVEKYYEVLLQQRITPKYSKTNKSSVISLFTGFNAHEKEKLKGFKPSKGWWVPGISLNSEELTDGEAQFLVFYRKVCGGDFTGVVPDNVKSMSYYEVYVNFLAILHDLGEL